LADKLVKKKIELFPKWYASSTASKVIQGIGRGNRNKEDWCITYILDGCFHRLYEETKEQFPEELRARISVL
jgi:Rad3-related DNA helicase